MLQFDITQYYSLYEVFERTGKSMFPEDWTGREIWSRPKGDPSSVIKEREELSANLSIAIRRKAEIDALDLSDLAQAVQTEFQNEWGAVYAEIDELKEKLAKLPNLSDTYIADHAHFTRRREVEDELWEAFTVKSMSVVLRNSNVADWRSWSKQPSFKVYYCLSMIKMPSQMEYQFRRSPAFVGKEEFSRWSERFGSALYSDDRYSPTQKARVWLQEQVDKYGGKPYGKPAFIEEMTAQFGISIRESHRIWREIVPDSWSNPGPPKPKSINSSSH